MADRLPPELWSYIFDLAADEDTIFYPGLQTSMAQSTWFKFPLKGWTVQTPKDTISSIQRRSYATKKVLSCLLSFSLLLTTFLCAGDHRGLQNLA